MAARLSRAFGSGSRRRRYGLRRRACTWFRVEQIELNLFGLVPRQTHERIVPLPFEARKYPSRVALQPVVVPHGFGYARDVQASPTIVTGGFNFLR